jgi:hypothetical protein
LGIEDIFIIERFILKYIAPQLGGWGLKKSGEEDKLDCITQHFPLLLSPA